MGLESQLDAIATLFLSSVDPAIVVGGEGRVLYANPSARRRWPQGSSIDALSALGVPLAPVLERGEPARLEWGERSPAGVRSWYVCAVSPLRQGEEVVAWLCVSTEVTDLKRTEERLRRAETLMVDTQGVAHLGTWEWDISEPHAFWSAELYRIYGRTPETYTPTYEAYLTLVHPEDRQRVIDATNRVFHEHVPYSHDERIFRPDGSMRHLHTWAHPILDEAGKLRRLVGVCQDITERKEAEEQVRRMNAELELRVAERTRQLETSMRDLESFNAMVSHDLRAPLGIIEVSSQVIGEVDPSRPAAGRAVGRIRRAVAQMAGLIDDLLAFASVSDARLNRVAIDLSEMARAIVADLEHTHPGRVVEVEIEAGMTCFADAGLMRIALGNILGNAWKYTSRVPVARIVVASAIAEGRSLFLVRDNGAGFDMKDAHRLFAPFQRLHSGDEFAGTGVGLASAQRIVERHGGRVWGEGVPGQGATFFIELPRAP